MTMAKTKGLDISYHNGSIDFKKVAAAGIDFIIPREGYRKTIDSKFLEYVKQARVAGISIPGVYHFMYPLTEADVEKEAASCVANVEKAGLGKNIIIFADLEYDTFDDAEEKGHPLSKSITTPWTIKFCEYVKKQGYRAGVYLNQDYYRNYYDMNQILAKGYVIWLADYEGEPNYPCTYQQYTHAGSCPGVKSSGLDMNYYYGEKTVSKGKTNSGLIAYAKAQLGLPYWWGTFGQIATISLYDAKKKQYPNYYTANDFSSQIGKRVHDCIGLIKGYLWSDSPTSVPKYNSAQDVNAAGMYALCSKKGTIGSFDKVPGRLLFRGATAEKIVHVGVYASDGLVYEAKGHAYGVVKSTYKASDWTHWGQCPWITCDTGDSTKSTETGTVAKIVGNTKKGMTGVQVKGLQTMLNGYGFNCGSVDGVFGAKTQAAVLEFQRRNGLTVDGIVGPKTWNKLTGLS